MRSSVWLAALLAVVAFAGECGAQVVGQPYLIPSGYEGYTPGTIITYGGRNYVIQTNRTMVLSQPQTVAAAPATVTSTYVVPSTTTIYRSYPAYPYYYRPYYRPPLFGPAVGFGYGGGFGYGPWGGPGFMPGPYMGWGW